MEQILNFIKPEMLSFFDFSLLVCLSFFTSALTAALGVGGGATLIAAMTMIMPTSAIIPVHAVVQLGSNGSRMWLMRKNIQPHYVLWFAVGSLIGALLGGQIAFNLDDYILELILGVFILFSCWSPIKPQLAGKKSLSLLGGVTSFLTMFVGATGPFVIATMRNVLPERKHLIATQAALMTIQHLIKAVVFGILGFQFGGWAGVVTLMIISGFFGTMAGKAVLERSTDNRYQHVLKWCLTLIALRLIWQSLAMMP